MGDDNFNKDRFIKGLGIYKGVAGLVKDADLKYFLDILFSDISDEHYDTAYGLLGHIFDDVPDCQYCEDAGLKKEIRIIMQANGFKQNRYGYWVIDEGFLLGVAEKKGGGK